ncbi:MAG TPA: hypothetical protein VMK82_04195 [Steroidobacteraceae bacterium]|nr:hypothetical protein [Steroidobacteraceae bacterium]
MKLHEYRQTYYDHTGAASASIRTLLLAGVAAVWLFKADTDGGGFALPTLALWGLLCFSAAAIFDVLQYLVLGEIYHFIFLRAENQGKKSDDELGDHPRWCNRPGLYLYWMKFATTFLGYVFLACFLAKRIVAT